MSRPPVLSERKHSLGWIAVPALLGILLLASVTQGQAPPPAAAKETTQAPTPPADQNSEMSSKETATTFRVNVKLVLVRVVVRDPKGKAIGNLQKDDFLLLDKGKPQVISQFSAEQPGTVAAEAEKTADQKAPESSAEADKKTPSIPERYIAYVFDDVHLKNEDLTRTRDAAIRHFSSLLPTDRAALFTTSGLTSVDFTDDHTKLKTALLNLTPHPITRRGSNDCPDIDFYQADLIVKNDPEATDIAIQESTECLPAVTDSSGRTTAYGNPVSLVAAAARNVLALGQEETNISLSMVKGAVQILSRMPGQRSMILVSPGFITPELEYQFIDIIDRAVRAQTTISAIDARGLYVIQPFGDASTHSKNSFTTGGKALIQTAAASANSNLLIALADGTGGTFFQKNNDFDQGFRQVSDTPEFSYVLGFVPQNIKLDGSYHALTVKLKNPQNLTLQSRRGYYAPKQLQDPAEQAKQEIEDAIFSQEQLHDLPLDLHTQFFKSSESDAKLTVLAHLDASRLHFRKADGRNNNELTVVSALFNSNGNFLEGNQKVVTMHFKDETLETKMGHGITMKTSFDVKPGNYLVRVVVRDADGQLSAQNGAVEIP